jgi:prevent-host-death family protein
MRSESISEAKNRLSALIKEVAAGEEVVITDRGVPVAKLVPIRLGRGVPAAVIALAQQGLATLPARAPSARWLDLPWPKVAAGVDAADAVIAERREGR